MENQMNRAYHPSKVDLEIEATRPLAFGIQLRNGQERRGSKVLLKDPQEDDSLEEQSAEPDHK